MTEPRKVIRLSKVADGKKIRRVVSICKSCGGKMSKGMTKCPHCGTVQ